jgi:hypothetical protein
VLVVGALESIASDFMEKHLSSDLIHAFVYGVAILREDQFQHLRDCKQCSDAWWRLKQHLSEQTPLPRCCEEKAALMREYRKAVIRAPNQEKVVGGRREKCP